MRIRSLILFVLMSLVGVLTSNAQQTTNNVVVSFNTLGINPGTVYNVTIQGVNGFISGNTVFANYPIPISRAQQPGMTNGVVIFSNTVIGVVPYNIYFNGYSTITNCFFVSTNSNAPDASNNVYLNASNYGYVSTYQGVPRFVYTSSIVTNVSSGGSGGSPLAAGYGLLLATNGGTNLVYVDSSVVVTNGAANVVFYGTNGTQFLLSGTPEPVSINGFASNGLPVFIGMGGENDSLGQGANPGQGGIVSIAGGGVSQTDEPANGGTVNLALPNANGGSYGTVNVGNLNILGSVTGGVLTNNATGVNLFGSFTGNGSGLTNLNVSGGGGTNFYSTNSTTVVDQHVTNIVSGTIAAAGVVTNGQAGLSLAGIFTGMNIPPAQFPRKLFVLGDSKSIKAINNGVVNGQANYGGYTNNSTTSSITNQPDGTIFYNVGAVGSVGTNDSPWQVFTNLVYQKTGNLIQLDTAMCFAGQKQSQIYSVSTLWPYVGLWSSDVNDFQPQGNNSNAPYPSTGQTNVNIAFYAYVTWHRGTANDLSFTINGTNYTCPVGGQVTVSTPDSFAATVVKPVTLFGTPNTANGSWFTMSAGCGDQYTPPYSLNVNNGTNNTYNGILWAISNAPATTGIPAAAVVWAGDNDLLYCTNPVNVPYVFSNNVACCAFLKTLGYYPVVFVTLPLNYNYSTYTPTNNANHQSLVNLQALQALQVTMPAKAADFVINAQNIVAPYYTNSTYYIDGTHGTQFLTDVEGTNFVTGIGWQNLPLILNPGAPNKLIGDGSLLTNLNASQLTSGFVSPSNSWAAKFAAFTNSYWNQPGTFGNFINSNGAAQFKIQVTATNIYTITPQ